MASWGPLNSCRCSIFNPIFYTICNPIFNQILRPNNHPHNTQLCKVLILPFTYVIINKLWKWHLIYNICLDDICHLSAYLICYLFNCQNPNSTTTQPQHNITLVGLDINITLHTQPIPTLTNSMSAIYQLLVTRFWAIFKERFWEILEQIPTVTVTFVQATLALENFSTLWISQLLLTRF